MICDICKEVKREYDKPLKKIEVNNKELNLCNECNNIQNLESYFKEDFKNSKIDLILASEVLKVLNNKLKKFKDK